MPTSHSPSSSSLFSTSDLIGLLDRWQKTKIVVVGDVMLDHQIYGYANRLAPDAPVPVLDETKQEFSPGGASNVCLDLRALHCHVSLLSVIGPDSPGRQLKQSLQSSGVNTTGLLIDPSRPTTVKQNLIGLAQHRHPQKMFRWDRESRLPISDVLAQRLLTIAKKIIPSAHALCLEDYNKGLLTPKLCQSLIALAKKHRVPVLVDPALHSDYSRYRHATTITPNRFEAAHAVGLSSPPSSLPALTKIGSQLQKQLRLDFTVLTLDKQGCLLLQKNAKPLPVPTVAQQVYDVTGAGDMVLAMLAAALANRIPPAPAVQLANIAAGLEVQRFGTVPIHLEEILVQLLSQQRQTQGKVRSLSQLLPELSAWRRDGKKIAFTNGCFDILHAGHVSYLRQARQHADLLIVGLNSDSSIRRLKGPTRPINHVNDRTLVLSELQCVDYIVVFDQPTPLQLIHAIKPDVLIKGADYKKSQIVGAPFVESTGGKIALIPLVQGRSTTNILRRIQQDA